MSDEFDTDLRTALHAAAATIERDEHRAARLIANARVGRTDVVALRRRRTTWLAPLLAAAAVVLVAAAVLVATNVFGGNRTRPATPTAPVPVGFRAEGIDFISPDLGFALGAWPCPQDAHPGLSTVQRAMLSPTGCPALIRTSDGGRSWSQIGFPHGAYVGNATVAGSAAGCPDSRPKPCVDHVSFADARRGYLWSNDAIYATTDGGRTWTQPRGPATRGQTWSLQIVGDHALRTAEEPVCANCAADLERARVGTNDWQSEKMIGTTAGAKDSLFAESSGTAYFVDETPGVPTYGDVWMLRDQGASWSDVWKRPCGAGLATSLAAATDGSLAVMCQKNARGRQSELRVLDHGHATVRGTIDNAPVRVAMVDQRHVFVVSPALTPKGVLVYLSHDGGHTFGAPKAIPAYASPTLTPQFVNSRVGFDLARNADGIVVTTDGGRTWQVRKFR